MSKLYPILRLLMPPIILKMRQDRLRSRHLLGPYATVEEALSQVKKDAFKGDVWEKHTNKKLLAPKNIDKDILPQHQVVLATLVGQLSISRLPLARSLKIVDWGGGGGGAVRHRHVWSHFISKAGIYCG
jgi:hypothetical protein